MRVGPRVVDLETDAYHRVASSPYLACNYAFEYQPEGEPPAPALTGQRRQDEGEYGAQREAREREAVKDRTDAP